jgi:hypothetical protein
MLRNIIDTFPSGEFGKSCLKSHIPDKLTKPHLLCSSVCQDVSLVGFLLVFGCTSRLKGRRSRTQTVTPIGVGPVISAVAGGLLVELLPAAAPKLVLGVILTVSAVRIFQG